MGKHKLTFKETLITILALILFGILIFILANFFRVINPESLHWMFSAAAQSIAALVAFLIAGYTFVHGLLREEEDETLIEINNEIKRKYYIFLKILIWSASISIIGDLTSIILIKNGYTFILLFYIYAFSFLLNILTILLAAMFVLYIMDPKREEKVAKELYKKIKFFRSKEKVDYETFLLNVVNFERLLRKILRKKKLLISEKPIQIRQMLDIMLKNQLIDFELMQRLDLIKRYRNLAVHGGIEKIDKAMADLVTQTMEELKEKFKV